MKHHNEPKAPHAGRDWADFPEACISRGISRAVAFDIVAAGLLDTWTLGRKRYVYLDSLISLPERMPEYRKWVEARKERKRAELRASA